MTDNPVVADKDRRPPVEVMLGMAEAVAAINHLLVLDGAWTGVEKVGGEFSPKDRGKVIAVGNGVDDALAGLEPHVATLRDVFATYPEWVNARVEEGLANEQLTAEQREALPRRLDIKDGDFAGRGVAVADDMKGRATPEREELGKKIKALEGDGPVETDIDHDLACGVGALVSMGAMAAGVGLESPPLFFAGAVGLAVVIVAC
jgi:hypothetical protein